MHFFIFLINFIIRNMNYFLKVNFFIFFMILFPMFLYISKDTRLKVNFLCLMIIILFLLIIKPFLIFLFSICKIKMVKMKVFFLNLILIYPAHKIHRALLLDNNKKRDHNFQLYKIKY